MATPARLGAATPARLRAATPARLGAAAASGLVVGALTWVLQWAGGPFEAINNSGAVWCVAAWAITAALDLASRPAAAVAGALVLVGADVGYYTTTTLVLNDDVNAATLRYPVIWAVVALIAGPVFGLAAIAWRRGPEAHGGIGLGALAGVLLAEALYLAVVLHGGFRAGAMLVFAFLVLLFLPRSRRQRAVALLSTVTWTVAGALVFGALWQLTG